MFLYCDSLTKYSRRKTKEVYIGKVPLGGHNPIRIQSMTIVDTMDTMGSVRQILSMVDSGCEYVRITAPSIKESQNLENIKNELIKKNCSVPLIADIHFTPNAAECAAKIVEKVRINPGNYADKKLFKNISYTDETYQSELRRIEDKFSPLVEICKKYGTAMRIGTNHGSLSDRIMSKYGDTPLGMVESALEFIRICESMSYFDLVISMKSSNPKVMVQAYRLLVNRLEEEKLLPYPLHLGVTEAGEGEDGRIKSALGIGTLLEDGLGDTVRVSLTEDPEKEAPVAKIIIDKLYNKSHQTPIPEIDHYPINPFEYNKRLTGEVANLGAYHPPRVIADFSNEASVHVKDFKSIGHHYLSELDKWGMDDLGADYIYTGSHPINFMLPNGLKEIIDYDTWKIHLDKRNKIPLYTDIELLKKSEEHLNFFLVDTGNIPLDFFDTISKIKNTVLLLESSHTHFILAMRSFVSKLINMQITLPVVFRKNHRFKSEDQLMVNASIDLGALFLDGLGDGIMLSSKQPTLALRKLYNRTAFGILQASGMRITKTEYISCPSCGRTLFDLQETTAMIRKRTDHLKGLKIGIMGCIVNGPGEMADADFGYVGSGKGKITLYKGQKIVKRNIPAENALNELIALIKEYNMWTEPKIEKNYESILN